MSRVLTFAKYFPAYHPRAGEPTHFVEKIWKSFMDGTYALPKEWHEYVRKYTLIVNDEKPIDSLTRYLSVDPKYHTIRAGNRWKIGDKFSPRQWSGKAYRSKQVIIGPDIEVRRVWNIEIKVNDSILIDGRDMGVFISRNEIVGKLAKSDGLSTEALLNWFPNSKDFDGQIICWNDKIEY